MTTYFYPLLYNHEKLSFFLVSESNIMAGSQVKQEKAWPGDGLPPTKPSFIEFRWNPEIKDKKSCDTLHILYLLQLGLEMIRLRTIERNTYFKSIGRNDRYINQLDAPTIINNFIKWHKSDPENNVFTGETLENFDNKLFVINKIISERGKLYIYYMICDVMKLICHIFK